ncbi:TRAP transporter small permease [Halalkalibacter oceani]|uniref:TRAP transporter small permease n=1 Tax=Halalkalibacter oceani TaxID=1653776 RepID=UPI0033983D10
MKRTLQALEKATDFFMLLMIIGIVIVVTLQVVFRYVFNISTPWTQDIARFMFIYLTYIGGALAIKERTHISIDVLVDRLPRMLRLIVSLGVQIGIMLFLIVLLQGSWFMVQSSWDVSSAGMRWFSMSYVYLGLFIGGVLMMFYSILRLIETVRDIVLKEDIVKNS